MKVFHTTPSEPVITGPTIGNSHWDPVWETKRGFDWSFVPIQYLVILSPFLDTCAVTSCIHPPSSLFERGPFRALFFTLPPSIRYPSARTPQRAVIEYSRR